MSQVETPDRNSGDLNATIELIEVNLIVIEILLDKYDQHSDSDIIEILVYLLRQITNIQLKLLQI